MANAVQTTDAPSNSTKVRAEKILQSVAEMVNTALPSTISRDKFRDTFLTAAKKEPKIFQADSGSVQLALIASANAGLLPDGKMAALVPFKNTKKGNILEVQFIIMVMGYIHLFKKHGGVHSMAVNVVYENDEFEYIEGDETILRHRPSAFLDDDERGQMIGVYGIFKDADGRVMHREVMGRKAVMKAKNVSKMKDSGPWQQFEEEMWRKTLVRRAAKYLPLTEEAQRIIDAEDQATVDFTLASPRQTQEGYSPLVEAAGIQQDNADEDGVVDHMEDQQRGDEEQGEQDEQGVEDDTQEGDIDTENIVDATEQEGSQEEERKPAEEKPRQQEQATKPSDRELDTAWNEGLDAKEAGKPREAPAEMTHPLLIKTWQGGWDKGVVKPAKEKAPPKKDTKAAPDADVVRDAKAKAMDGADRVAPENLNEKQAQDWLEAYDAQVKDAEENG